MVNQDLPPKRDDSTITDLDSLRAIMIGRQMGDYKIIEEIGHGGMGIVYKGIHTFLEQEVAIKMLNPALTIDPKVKERFLKEAKIQCKLVHPNIVTIHNFVQLENYYCIIMEFIHGRSIKLKEITRWERNLSEAIAFRGPFSISVIKDIFLQVLDALIYAHSKSIVHRDIKPSNILFTELGTVKLSDFGIAKILVGDKTKTMTGQTIGTAWYISPEQVLAKPVDARSDIYSLGITLYEMATGKVPFDGDTDFSIYRAHVEKRPRHPRELNPNISKELETIILKAIAKEPNGRYNSTEELYSAIESLQIEPTIIKKPIEEKKEKKKEVKVRISRKKSKKTFLIGLFSLLAIIIISGFLILKKIDVSSIFSSRAEQKLPIVPNLIGMSTEQTTDTLQSLGLELKILGEKETDDYTEGFVCEQDKKVGDTLNIGDTVDIYKSIPVIKFCPKCGVRVSPTDKFCPDKGHKIRD